MRKRSFVLASILFLLTACNAMDITISDEITKQFEAHPTRPIELAHVGPPTWKKVCILTPYSNNKATEETLGFKWDSESKTSIGVSDGINVLVFIDAQEVVAYTEHPRNKGDFSKLGPRCFDRKDSTFVRQVDDSGWVYLVTSIHTQH